MSHDYKRKGVKPRLGTDPRVMAITGVFVTDMHTDTYTGASRGPSQLEQEEQQRQERRKMKMRGPSDQGMDFMRPLWFHLS